MQRVCEICHRRIDEKNFYQSNNLEKYPGKFVSQCKKCMTMNVDNWDAKTYEWILKELDVPYVPNEWYQLMNTYARDPSKVNGTTILGRYLAKMRLKAWKDYRYNDSQFIIDMNKMKLETTMEEQGFSKQDMERVLNESTLKVQKPEDYETDAEKEAREVSQQSPSSAGRPGGGTFLPPGARDERDDYIESKLSDREKDKLRIKWGQTYRPSEWVVLEDLYNQMIGSYDITSAGDINTLILACKASLKANQLMDLGDIEGATKATRMYDTLMKSGKWTAAQNKQKEEGVIYAVCELVKICESKGFIPRFYVDGPQDHADRVIQDLKQYTGDLVTGEADLSTMIENAAKQIELENERMIEYSKNSAIDAEEEDLFQYNTDKILGIKDYSEFQDFQLEQEEHDLSLFKEE